MSHLLLPSLRILLAGMFLWASFLEKPAYAQNLDLTKDVLFSNDKVRFRFQKGTLGLAEMTDLATGMNHLKGTGNPSLWELTFATGAQRWNVSNTKYQGSRAAIERSENGIQRLQLEWNDVRWFKEDKALTVRVTVELHPGDGVGLWRISVNNSSDTWGLWSVSFPKITGLPKPGEYDIASPYFGVGGILLPKWKAAVEGEYPSGGWSMQVAALSKQHDSVYLSTYDPDGWRKDFNIDPSTETLRVLHYPEGMAVAGSDFTDPYPIAFGPYQGDWTEAALRYRKWALQQKWASAGPLSQRTDWSKRLADIGYWMVYNFPLNDPEEVPLNRLPEIAETARRRLDTQIGIHWYRWHQVPFDNLYPNFLPPVSEFSGLANDLTKRGFLVMPYINGVSADRSAPNFKKYEPGAVKDQAGGLVLKYYLESSGRLFAMCGTDPVWRETVTGLIRDLADKYHVNGIYIDQIAAYSAEQCFDPKHGHTLGGGNYSTHSYRELLKMVQDIAKGAGRDITITSESQNEAYLDLLDATLAWGTYTGFEIPFFDTVYSGYTVSFGSVCPLDSKEQFFRRTQGTAALDGRQLGWLSPAIFKEQHQSKVEYLKKALAFRKNALGYLLYGNMLRPLSPTTPVPSFEDDSSLQGTKQRVQFPGAEARIWKNQNGQTALLFANFLDEPVKFSYRINAADIGLSPGTHSLTDVRESRRADLGTFTDVLTRVETLPPLGFKLIEISSNKKN